MLTRINFLLGLGLLIVIGFYFAGRFLVLAPLAALAPAWAKPAAGLAVLIALGLTVQLLATAMGAMPGVASYEGARRPGTLAVASQAALVCGHAGLGFVWVGLLTEGPPISDLPLLVVAALYSAGIVIAVHEWRLRKLDGQ